MPMHSVIYHFNQQGLPFVLLLPLFFLYVFARRHSEERATDQQSGYFLYGVVVLHYSIERVKEFRCWCPFFGITVTLL
jgi:hypothetical protein